MTLKRRYIFPFIWIGLMTYGLLTPNDDLPKFQFIPHFDKLVHFVIYGVLTILMIPATLKNRRYQFSYWFSFLLVIFIGLLFEFLQAQFTTSRSASFGDILTNTLGATIALLFYHYFLKEKRIENILFKIE